MFLVRSIEIIEGKRITVGESYAVNCKTRHGVVQWKSQPVIQINIYDSDSVEVAFQEPGSSFRLWVPIEAIMFSSEDEQYDACSYREYW